MKAFIIHTSHEKSLEYANNALVSFAQYVGWEPELFLGLTPRTLSIFENGINIKTKPRSRANDYYNEDPNGRYIFKKSCSLNHYRLFNMCVELDEPIAIVEHDSFCVGDWTPVVFDEVLVLNVESALRQEVLRPIWSKNTKPFKNGVHDICLEGFQYRHDPDWNGAHMMPGTAAYAITPTGARKMVAVYEQIGWEQSDFIINTYNVRIQTIIPELFTFRLPNLKTSHGDLVL